MDGAAFARLVEAHSGRLVLYARQWAATPEDAVQEAFLRLARLRPAPDDPVAWLYRATRNAAIDIGKGERRRGLREAASARRDWFVQPEVDGLDAEAAVAALGRLSPEQREVLVSRIWGDLSFEQIAAVMGGSASTAHRRYEAGIEALRRLLGESCPTT
jgi:RNA polymerase sigma-70 factor (ECF subfamily)